jgi:hypothetical protein
MVRILLFLFSIIIFSIFLGHLTPAKAQGTGTLSVTTTPVRGPFYYQEHITVYISPRWVIARSF